MKRDDSVYIHHMLDAVAKIEEYTRGINKETFYSNTLFQDGGHWVSLMAVTLKP